MLKGAVEGHPAADFLEHPEQVFELAGGILQELTLDICLRGVDFRVSGRAEAVSDIGGTLRLSELCVCREGSPRLPGEKALCLAFMLSRSGAFSHSSGAGEPLVEIETLILNPETGEISRDIKQKTAAELSCLPAARKTGGQDTERAGWSCRARRRLNSLIRGCGRGRRP